MDPIEPELLSNGFAFRPGTAIHEWLGPGRPDWGRFAASWNTLGEDRHMADGGRYRRRRYAVFDVTGNDIVRAPHQPHFQAKTYNRSNGGLDRWFDPVVPEIGDHIIIRKLIERLTSIFTSLPAVESPSVSWHVELHQFRIEATANAVGLPTPEGAHRDGVDGAFVMLINRENVSSGITQVSDANGRSLGQFTLSQAGDAVFLDDKRVFHGVTPIEPLDPGRLAIRDVLVITFTRV
ncbi:MAG: 2OG-Fe dioxygenase family protein [Alphaproteobacteria bacterium]|nr:2OG-Fe dioxygenase family protein [Alphaproteobacteria bacterium]